MKKIGFIGAYDKANFIIYVAKIIKSLNYKVLVIDTSSIQKTKYIIPSINPTKSYITDFEGVDFAIGFENWEEIEKYLGARFDSNEDTGESQQVNEKINAYDYILIDVDSQEKLERFDMQKNLKNYFVTGFDTFSLKKGLSIFENLKQPMELTKVLFSYETSKEDEEYLDFLAMEYKINWNQYVIYFQILGDDNKVFEENQKLQKIRFRRLSLNYKESVAYIVQDICKGEGLGTIKRIMKD